MENGPLMVGYSHRHGEGNGVNDSLTSSHRPKLGGNEVIDACGDKIGHIYRTGAVGGGYVWRWSVYGIASHTGTDPGGRAGGVQGSVGNLPAARERGA